MRTLTNSAWLTALCAAGAIAAHPVSSAIVYNAYAIAPDGDLHRVNTSLGLNQLIGTLPIPGAQSLAQDSSGALWTALGGTGSISTQFYKVDPSGVTLDHQFGPSLGGVVRAMAFDELDRLFVVVDPAAAGPDLLYRIVPSNPLPFLIGSTAETGIVGLAITPWGKSYVWHSTGAASGKGLMEISLTTGATVDVNAGVGGGSFVQSLTLNEHGRLLGAGSELFAIDSATGTATQIGSSAPGDWTGLVVGEAMDAQNVGVLLERDGDMYRVNALNGGRHYVTDVSNSPVAALERDEQSGKFIMVHDHGSALATLHELNFNDGSSTQLQFGTMNNPHGGCADRFLGNRTYTLVDSATGGGDELLAFNSGTNALSLAHVLNSSTVEAIETGPFNGLVAWDSVLGLATAPLTVPNVPLFDANPAFGAIQPLTSISFDSRWVLIGASDRLYEIALDGASLTPLGSSGLVDVVGLEFLTSPPPSVVTTYCTAQTNSQGCVPEIRGHGDVGPRANSTIDFLIFVSNTFGQRPGLFFYGLNGRNNAPFLGGTMCVAQPLRRTPLQTSDGSAALCNGRFFFEFNAYARQGADPSLVAGVEVNVQCWSRDAAAPSGTNLTAALEFTILP